MAGPDPNIIGGYSAALAQLKGVPRALNAAYRRAARLTATQALKLARSKAPKRKSMLKVGGEKYLQLGGSGQLKKSLGSKVWTNKKTGWVGFVVGPRKGYKIRVMDPFTRKMRDSNPTRYAHLVEKGFVGTVFGRGRRSHPGRPFLRPAEALAKSVSAAITAGAVNEALAKLQGGTP